MKNLLFFLIAFLTMVQAISGQDSSRLNKLISLPNKLFNALDKKTRSIEEKLDRQTNIYLNKLQRQERKLKKKLARKDSLLAKEIFGNIDSRYKGLRNTTGSVNKYSSVYSGHLDSLSTALSFLKAKDLTDNP